MSPKDPDGCLLSYRSLPDDVDECADLCKNLVTNLRLLEQLESLLVLSSLADESIA